MKRWIWILFLMPGVLWNAPRFFQLHELGYFHRPGMDVLVFSNEYDALFGDAKISGIEIILHDERIATNGDVRIGPTPCQWDWISKPVDQKIDPNEKSIWVQRAYPEWKFQYEVRVQAFAEHLSISVWLERPIPDSLEHRIGFNLEFCPSAYFSHTYLMDSKSGVFPISASGFVGKKPWGLEPKPLCTGKEIVLSPEDPFKKVKIHALDTLLSLYDGRTLAQNGWFVVHSPIPAKKIGKVLEWIVSAEPVSHWTRPPVIAHSQVGYCPNQKKLALIECDPEDRPRKKARVLEVLPNGKKKPVYEAKINPWGKYLRYMYYQFDFTPVQKPGLYVLQYGDRSTLPFRIGKDVYQEVWYPTLDIYLPVQMDHIGVREAYRVWHGPSHLDDARQAPPNHVHFDLYAQGPSTDSPYAPGEHIPGLNVGGWFDAGDFDIRTQSQYAAVLMLGWIWDNFQPLRDQTTVDRKKGWVELHVPDGIPDILQQIEHGVLGLLAQHRAIGHAICGIIAPDLKQYTHIGDAHSKTDNRIYNPTFPPDSSYGLFSSIPDDRWAFTSRSTGLNYGSAAALACASRALRGYRDELAHECLTTAIRVWEEEENHEPFLFQHGNTTGGHPDDEKFRCAVELLRTTKESRYAQAIWELWPKIKERFPMNVLPALQAIPYMDSTYTEQVRQSILFHKKLFQLQENNPFGVPVRMGTWGGNGWVVYWAITNYFLYQTFPNIGDPEAVFRGLHFIYGCHPGSDISFVSGVGTRSKTIAYGNNRADFSFIPGGIVPGIVIIKPNFPENKEDWPFLWGENEYVVNLGPAYIFLVHAVEKLCLEK